MKSHLSGCKKGRPISFTARLVKPENTAPQSVEVNLIIRDKVLVDRGDSETWRHSRLRWLNSTLGIDDNPTKPFSPIVRKDDFSFDLTGKTIVYDQALMPGSIEVRGEKILTDFTLMM